MARFRAVIQGARGSASRLGHAKSGVTVEAQSWQGKVSVYLYAFGDADHVRIEFGLHSGQGIRAVLYDGPVNGAGMTVCGVPIPEVR